MDFRHAIMHMQQGLAVYAFTELEVCIAVQFVSVIEEFGPDNFGAIVSDNGGGCENGRILT